MGILFRPTTNKKNKIIKRQEGGTIPVYGSFQVQHAQSAPYNPLALLSKYQFVGSGKTVNTDKGAGKESKLPDIKGLTNDGYVLGEEIYALEKEFESGMASDPEFESSPLGRTLRRKLDLSVATRVNAVARSKEEYDLSLPIMRERRAEGSPVFKDGRYLAVRMVEDNSDPRGFSEDYQKITPEEYHKTDEDGNSQWDHVLTYGELANARANSMNTKMLFSGEYGETAARDISYGMGMDYVENEILDENYTDIGKTLEDNRKQKGGDVTETGAVLQMFVEGKSVESNEAQLKTALSKIRNYIPPPAMDALRGHFGLTSKSAEDVENKINKYLAAHMAQRLGYAVKIEDVSMWETPEARALKDGTSGGGESNTLAPLSVYVTEASEVLNPKYINHEKGKGFGSGKGKTQNVMTLVAWDAPETTKLLDPTSMMSAQNTGKAGESGSFASAGNVNEAQDGEGNKLSGKSYTIAGTDGALNFMDMAMPAAGQTIRLTRVPVKDGKLFRAALDDIEALNTQIAAIEKNRDAAGDLARPGTSLWEKAKQEIEVVKNKVLSKYPDVTLEPRYLVDVVFLDPDNKTGLSKMGNVSEDDYANYIKKFGQEDGIADNWSWTQGGEETIRENLNKTTIMVPTNDLVQLQHLGATVYASKSKLTAGALEKDETYRRYKDANINDLYLALRDKYGDNAGAYETMYLRQLMSQK